MYCAGCTRKSQRKYKLANPERRKEQDKRARIKGRLKTKLRNITKTYGLSSEEYATMLLEQKGCCYICATSFDKVNPTVDHSHTSGAVRGILCGKCNAGLGMFKDNVDFVKKAVEYLNNHEKSRRKIPCYS